MRATSTLSLCPSVALGDGLEGLRSLERGSVALVLSDLPSGETRAATDRRPSLDALWPAVWHSLRDDGAAVFMASCFTFAAALVASQPDAFRYDLIWHKSIAGGFLNATRRPLRAHEFVLVFSRSQTTYNPQMRQGVGAIHQNYGRGSTGENYGAAGGGRTRKSTDRYPWSVLPFASVGTSAKCRSHHQQKPVDLLRWCVRTYSNAGDLVVDPYAGSGSTGVACDAENRLFLGWDNDPRFGIETRRIG